MKCAYSFVVLRYVHDIVTQEFVNLGIVALSPASNTAAALRADDLTRAKAFFPGLDEHSLLETLAFIQTRIPEISAEADLKPATNARELAERVLPRDDSSLQWSPTMGGGLTEDLHQAATQLFQRMVAGPGVKSRAMACENPATSEIDGNDMHSTWTTGCPGSHGSASPPE